MFCWKLNLWGKKNPIVFALLRYPAKNRLHNVSSQPGFYKDTGRARSLPLRTVYVMSFVSNILAVTGSRESPVGKLLHSAVIAPPGEQSRVKQMLLKKTLCISLRMMR